MVTAPEFSVYLLRSLLCVSVSDGFSLVGGGGVRFLWFWCFSVSVVWLRDCEGELRERQQ